MFKIGDKVRCIDNENGCKKMLQLDQIYTVTKVDYSKRQELVLFLKECATPVNKYFFAKRFENVSRKLKLERVLRCKK